MTFKTYPKILTVGYEDNKELLTDPNDIIIVQEKMDGANFRFMLREGRIIFGSRTQELSKDKEHKYAKNFERAASFVINNIDTKLLQYYDNHIFYGECMVKHTLDYQWDNIPPFLGFDIYDLKQEKFLPYYDVKTIYDALGLTIVPIVTVTIAEAITAINDDLVPLSKYAPHKAEGIVFKNYRKGIFAKYVRDEFKEKNSEVFGGTPKVGLGEEANFTLRYATNARIDKHIFKLLDEGQKLELGLMKTLPNNVWDDIWDEEYKSIIKDHKALEFKAARTLVTKRCLAVLKQVITNNALTTVREEATT